MMAESRNSEANNAAFARQRRGKHISAETDTYATIDDEVLLWFRTDVI
jgi:hypothetical protein